MSYAWMAQERKRKSNLRVDNSSIPKQIIPEIIWNDRNREIALTQQDDNENCCRVYGQDQTRIEKSLSDFFRTLTVVNEQRRKHKANTSTELQK